MRRASGSLSVDMMSAEFSLDTLQLTRSAAVERWSVTVRDTSASSRSEAISCLQILRKVVDPATCGTYCTKTARLVAKKAVATRNS